MAVCLLVICAPALASTWQPAAGHTQMPLWPGTPPDAKAMPGPETEAVRSDHLIAGKPWTAVTNVSQPTLTVYAPRGHDTGAAVVVFAGGGFQVLAIDLEGTEVCHWLTSIGVTCVLLKYRVPSAPYDWRCKCYRHGADAVSLPALQDAQRALRLVRAHAAAWRIDPRKVGVIGFSAGGYLVAETSADFDQSTYAPVDAADRQSDRPDFALAIYPGHMVTHGTTAARYGVTVGSLNPHIRFTRATPPTFIVQAEDAEVDHLRESLVYYTALAQAGVPAELHVYAKGGHAFGLRRTALPITRWPELATSWLHTIGVLPVCQADSATTGAGDGP
ncbi:MAG TPA: alpha/beta hydrolase [Rhodanobacteraceae bacterium]